MNEKTRGLVIGADSGIGEAFVNRYLEGNMKSGDWSMPSKGLLDVADRSSVDEYFMDKAASGQYFDQVVFSAGINYLEWIGKLDPWETQQVIQTNLIGFIWVIDALMKYQPNHPASIVVVGSDAAERPLRTSISYTASKAGLHMAVRSAARELGPMGWRINVVAPGMTGETGMQGYVDKRVMEVRGWTEKRMRNYEASQEVVPGRVGKHEVAKVIFDTLNGPRHLNGSIIMINGGR